jgi:hypothetical protein
MSGLERQAEENHEGTASVGAICMVATAATALRRRAGAVRQTSKDAADNAALLVKPIRLVHFEAGGDASQGITMHTASMQGWRRAMEDAHRFVVKASSGGSSPGPSIPSSPRRSSLAASDGSLPIDGKVSPDGLATVEPTAAANIEGYLGIFDGHAVPVTKKKKRASS